MNIGAETTTPATGRGLVPHIDHIGAGLARFARRRTGATARAVRARLVRLRRNTEQHQQDLKQSTSARSVQLPPLIPSFFSAETLAAGEGAAPARPPISSQLLHTVARPIAGPAPSLGAGRQQGRSRSAPSRERRLSRGAIALGVAAALSVGIVAYAVSRDDYTKPTPLPVAEGLTPEERQTTTTTSPVGSAITGQSPPLGGNGPSASAAPLSRSRGTGSPVTAGIPRVSAGSSTGEAAPSVAATPSNPSPASGLPPASSPPPSTPPPSSSPPPNPLCQLVPVLCR
jgi:hypothetical protein